MNREELAWAAGIIDGEGCTYLNRQQHGMLPALAVSQSSADGPPQMLERLSALFGGNVRGPATRAGRLPIYRWNVTGYERTQAAIAAIWPWLGDVKREQAAAVLIEFREHWRPPGQRKRETHARRRAEV